MLAELNGEVISPPEKPPEVNNSSPPVAFALTTTEAPSVVKQQPVDQVQIASDAIPPPLVNTQRHWLSRVALQQLWNEDLRQTGKSSYEDQGIGFNEDGIPVDKATTPHAVWDRGFSENPRSNKGSVDDASSTPHSNHENGSCRGSGDRHSRTAS